MKIKFMFLAMAFSLFSFVVSAQWSPATYGIHYSSGNVGIGNSPTSDRTLLLYNQTNPYFGIKNQYGSIDIGVANIANDFSLSSRPGDSTIKLHNSSYSYHGLFINLNDNNSDGNSFVKFCDNSKVIMAIYNNANVKIDGKLFAKEIEVKTNVWADFVFKPNYKLMPLDELESFIKTNNHLPNIPSEAEVKADGINIAEMNAKLLQKVEELTLYVIEQQKQIEELRKANKSIFEPK